LSLQPSHRRGWGSLYNALSLGRIDTQTLRRLLAHYPLGGSETTPVYAVDVSVWDRCDAECSPEACLSPGPELTNSHPWASRGFETGPTTLPLASLTETEKGSSVAD
jgi:hypothetical protein